MEGNNDLAQVCHEAALLLMKRPPLAPEQQALVAGLLPAAGALWTVAAGEDGDAAAPIRAEDFLQALDHLLPDAAAAGAERLVPVLGLLGPLWRRAPGLVLAAMAFQLAAAADRKLVALEIVHVAHWIAQTEQSGAGCDRQWTELVQDAQRWRFHDEIALRQTPSAWAFPLAVPIGVAGFGLTPITTTAQLVDSHHHKGALCLAVRRDACLAGREAWLFARPLLLASPEGLCLVGLSRPAADDDWGEPDVYAPVELQDLVWQAAASIVARENAGQGLARVRRAAHGLSLVSQRASGLLKQLLG